MIMIDVVIFFNWLMFIIDEYIVDEYYDMNKLYWLGVIFDYY